MIPKIKKIYDLSIALGDDTPVWPGDNHFHFEPRVKMEDGSICNSSTMSCTVHCVTHADAPKHYVVDGKDMAQADLGNFCGAAKVITILTDKDISKDDLEKIDIKKDDIVLIKTSNKDMVTSDYFHRDFVSFDLSAAEYLVKKGVRCIGIDYVSIEKFGTEDGAVHRTILESEMGVLEGLNLYEVPDGEYFLTALPLKIKKSDGSPVRAALIEFE